MTFASAVVTGSSLAFAIAIVQHPPMFTILIVQSPPAFAIAVIVIAVPKIHDSHPYSSHHSLYCRHNYWRRFVDRDRVCPRAVATSYNCLILSLMMAYLAPRAILLLKKYWKQPL